MKSQTIVQTFNGAVEWYLEGAYFKLMETVNAVDVALFLRGREVLSARGVSSGFYQRVVFDRVQITTGGAEEVTFLAAAEEGGSDSVTGAIDVTDQASRLVGIVYGALGQLAQVAIGGVNALQVTERGLTYGASYVSNANGAANTPAEIFSAASNANGAMLWAATIWNTTIANSHAAMLAKATAPATVTDGVPLLVNTYLNGTSAAPSELARPVCIPAGLGLYWISGALEQGNPMKRALYSLL